MATVLDHTQDLSGAEQHRLTSLYQPPDYVKQAGFAQLCGNTEELPETVFAYPTRRLYRCHTKAATWMSALFFFDKRKELPEALAPAVRHQLEKAAAHYGITKDVAALFEKMAADEAAGEERLPDEVYALVMTDDTGRKQRQYPLRNVGEVKVAADWFAAYRGHFTYPDRRTIAGKLLDRGAALNAELPHAEMLAKTAGYGYCAASDAAAAWQERARLTIHSRPDFSKEAAATAASILKNPPRGRDAGVREKMAELMDQFDHASGIAVLYDKGLDRPEDVLFKVTEKAAAEFLAGHVQLTSGSVYEKQALADVPTVRLREWLGGEVADEVSVPGRETPDVEKLAEVLSVLPRPDAELFDRLARQLQIRPVMMDKAAAVDLFSKEEIDGLRKIYQEARATVAS